MNDSTSRDRLWRKRLTELSAVWPDFVGGRTTGLHKTRVASRRLREALPVVGVGAPPAKVKRLNRKLRQLTRYLGPIRELDVELGLLDDRARRGDVSVRAIEMVRREIASKRQALRHELAENAPVGDLKKLVRKLERVAAPARGQEQWRDVLAARLLRRARNLRAALDQAGPLYAPERIHAVRITVKKLRYTLEIARDAGLPRAGFLVRALQKQQERLGRLHDLQTLLKRVRAAEASPGVGSRVNDLTVYADTLEKECRRLHAGFLEHRDDLAICVKEVRQHLVPSMTVPLRRQARAGGATRPAARAHAK